MLLRAWTGICRAKAVKQERKRAAMDLEVADPVVQAAERHALARKKDLGEKSAVIVSAFATLCA